MSELFVGEDRDGGMAVVQDNGDIVASVHSDSLAGGLARAQLFAAAPELLAAAEDAIQALERLPDVEGAYRVTCIAQLRKAIDRAKGVGR